MIKISNEAKIGIFATLTIAAAIWGYKFLKGQSLLSRSVQLYAEFPDAQQINRSAPIYFHGVNIGSVQDIFFKPEDMSKAILLLSFKSNPGIPKNARAVLFSNGMLGGKAVNLEFDHPCKDDDCAVSGAYIKGVTRSSIESLIGTPESLDPYMDKAKTGVKGMFDTLKVAMSDPNNELNKSFRDIQATIVSLRQTTAALNQLMAASAGSFNATMKNVEGITGNLKNNNDKINSLMTNINDISGKANTVDFSKINKATEGAEESINELKKTLSETQKSLSELTSTLQNVNKGEGTIGQFATNDSVYHSLNMTLLQTQALMQDIRLNPKRYINLNPFRKYKNYIVPSQDPLMDTLQGRYNTTKN
jgi:phospholipid/cholesterol/gamma-HCH transport system substrate-binding protein